MENIKILNDELFKATLSIYANNGVPDSIRFVPFYLNNSIGIYSGKDNKCFYVYITNEEDENNIKLEKHEFDDFSCALQYARALYLGKLALNYNYDEYLYNEKLFMDNVYDYENKELDAILLPYFTGITCYIEDGIPFYGYYSYENEVIISNLTDEYGKIKKECNYGSFDSALKSARRKCILNNDKYYNGNALFINEKDGKFYCMSYDRKVYDVDEIINCFEDIPRFDDVFLKNNIGISTASVGDFKYYIVYWNYNEPDEFRCQYYKVPCLTFGEAVSLAKELYKLPYVVPASEATSRAKIKKFYEQSRQAAFNKYCDMNVDLITKELINYFKNNKPNKKTLD